MNWFPLAVGNLEPYIEPGTQNLNWAVHDNSLPGYHGLFTLHQDDFLRILNENQSLLWEGKVNLDYEKGWEAFVDDPMFGRQLINGQRVNGIQKDVESNEWQQWFLRHHRAVIFRKTSAMASASLSPLLQSLCQLPTEHWHWAAPQRFFDGMKDISSLERQRIIGDLPPAVAWISHALGWTGAQVAASLDIPETLANQWAAPSDLPWHRPRPENPEWETRSAYLLAFYAHLHWTLGENVSHRNTWSEGAKELLEKASQSFSGLQEAIAELAPNPDDLLPPA